MPLLENVAYVLDGKFGSLLEPFQNWLFCRGLHVRLGGDHLVSAGNKVSTKGKFSPGRGGVSFRSLDCAFKHSYGCVFPDFPKGAKGVSMGDGSGSVLSVLKGVLRIRWWDKYHDS